MVGDKFRFRFRKSGDLRFLSHLDLTRSFERMLRRAELPFKSSQGFHPSPRMVFALSLPLGVVGDEEVLELELTSPDDSESVREKLNRQTPRGLDFHSVSTVPMKATAMPRRAVYTMPIPKERIPTLQSRIDEVVAGEKLWVERMKPKPRMLNVRPYLRLLRISQTPPPDPLSEAERGSGGELCLDFWVTTSGTARVDEIIKALGIPDLVDAGATVTRRWLELHDETHADQPDGPPDGIPESSPLNHIPAQPGTEPVATVATWGMSPSGPVVE